jgi:hypothetical protein
MPLSVTEKLRTLGTAACGARIPVFGWLERAGRVHATFYRFPSRSLSVTSLTPEEADALAAHLVALGHALPYVTADHSTTTAFAGAETVAGSPAARRLKAPPRLMCPAQHPESATLDKSYPPRSKALFV